MDFLAPPPPAVRPIGVNEAEVEFYATADRDSFVGALIPLAKQACVVLAWRAARRVYVVTDLRNAFAEAVGAGVDVTVPDWCGCPVHAIHVAANVFIGGASDDRAAYWDAVAAAAGDAYAYTHSAAAQDDVRAATAVDFSRIKQLAQAAGAIPLSRWDDPRLGPLWPEGAPAWHTKAERELRELKDEIANRPDPFAPPVGAEKLAQIKDFNFLSGLHRRGGLDGFGGSYVIAFREQIVGHGRDLAAARAEVAARLGVPETRLATTYVHGF